MTLVPDSLAFPFALEWLIGAALRSAALIGIAALVALALRRAPAAVRHLVWTLALIGCAAMPLAALIVPGWSLPGLPAWSARIESAPQFAAPSTAASQAPTENPAPAHASNPTAERTPPTRSATAWRPTGADLLRALPTVWLAGALLMLAWHLLGWIRLSRVARRAPPMADDAWQGALARHAATLRIRRPPALRVSPDVAVPFVYGARRPAIVVPAVAGTWSAERRDVVLLHELAHIRRRDLVSARVTQLAATLYWFHPIVWIAARAQRAEAERACDDQVLDAGGRASAYASDLLEIARAVSGRERLDAAALAMARRSQLEGRLLAILDPRLRRGGAGRVTVLVGALVAACTIAALAAARPARSERVATVGTGATVVAPVATSATAAEAPVERGAQASSADPPQGTSRVDAGPLAAAAKKPVVEGQQGIITVNDGKSMVGNWNYKSDRGARLSSHGKVRYSANLDDIESLSPDGWVEVEDRREGKWHKASFRNRAGGIERKYQVDGVERPWDTNARAWLAGFLVELDRGSGALVEARFPHLLNEGGPDRVLREVSEMTSDYGRGVYLRRLAAADLDDATVRRAVVQAGREIESDYELTQTLIAVAEHHALDDAATRSAYLEASNSLQSDYEHGRALHALIQRRNLSPALVDGAIASASRMESDYEQAQLMIAMAEKGHVTGPAQGPYIRATHSMDSDYEKGRVLSALLAATRLTGESVGHVLLATETFQSDYERANVLVRLAESVPMSDAQRAAFVESTKGMSSDHDRQRALAALAQSLGR